jgi:hypothetical protein
MASLTTPTGDKAGSSQMIDEEPPHRPLTYEEMKLWKVPQLKNYLRDRGLKTTWRREELLALAFGAEQLGIPPKPSALEEKKAKAAQYQDRLTVNGEKLPDPFMLKGWLDEENALDKWPPTMQFDIADYLLHLKDQSLTKRLISGIIKKERPTAILNLGGLRKFLTILLMTSLLSASFCPSLCLLSVSPRFLIGCGS